MTGLEIIIVAMGIFIILDIERIASRMRRNFTFMDNRIAELEYAIECLELRLGKKIDRISDKTDTEKED